MTAAEFCPRQRVIDLGPSAHKAVLTIANGGPITPATLYAAADSLRATRPRIAKRLHDLGAVWSVNHKGVRA